MNLSNELDNVGAEAKKTAITSLVNVLGHGEIFGRVKAEIERKNKTMPHATGKEKLAVALADFEIIFDDLAVPVATDVLNLLIELAVQYLKVELLALV